MDIIEWKNQVHKVLHMPRAFTAAELRYVQHWFSSGDDIKAIKTAYDRTCLNTGGLNWAYMNKLLEHWREAASEATPSSGCSGSEAQVAWLNQIERKLGDIDATAETMDSYHEVVRMVKQLKWAIRDGEPLHD